MKRNAVFLALLGLAAARPAVAQHCTLATTLSLGANDTLYGSCVLGNNVASWSTSGTYLGSLPAEGGARNVQWEAGRLLVIQSYQRVMAQYGLAGYQNQITLEGSPAQLAFDPATGDVIRVPGTGLQVFNGELKLLHQIATDTQGVALGGGSIAVIGNVLWYSIGAPGGGITNVYAYPLKALESGTARQIASFQAPVNFAYGGQMAADASFYLYLCANARQVVKINRKGKIVLTLPVEGTSCDAIAVDTAGTIYEAASDNSNGGATTIYVFNPQGTLINSFN